MTSATANRRQAGAAAREVVDLSCYLRGVPSLVGRYREPAAPETGSDVSEWGHLLICSDPARAREMAVEWRTIDLLPSSSDVEACQGRMARGRRHGEIYCLVADPQVSIPQHIKHLHLGYDYVLLPWSSPETDCFTQGTIEVSMRQGSQVIARGLSGSEALVDALRAGVWLGILDG